MKIDPTDKSLWLYTRLIAAGGTLLSKQKGNGHTAGAGRITPLGFECDIVHENQPFADVFYNNLPLDQSYIGLSENLNKRTLNKIVKDVEDIICSSPEIKCVLVVCGTDAMEQVAREINKKLGPLIKERGIKVILTGGNRRLTRKDTDGWNNLQFAFIKGHSEDVIPGVYVGFHGRLIPAEFVVKELFDGKDMNYISRKDRDYFSSVRKQKEESNEIIYKLGKKLPHVINGNGACFAYQVNVIRSRQDKLRTKLASQMPRTVVLILYHSSTANTDQERPIASVARVIEDFRNQTVFFAVTENAQPVDLSSESYETSVMLGEKGLIPLGTMNAQVALAKLKMCSQVPIHEIIDLMTTNIAGELDEGGIDKKFVEGQKVLYG